MYEKGYNKKEFIYSNAKTILYNKGYTKTTIKEIASYSDIPVSLVHYYFRKKDDILKNIYADFLNNIYSFLHSNNLDIFHNTLLTYTVTQRIYYEIILRDKNNSRVYHEVLQSRSNWELVEESSKETYQKIIQENDVIITDELFKSYILLEFGARREFFLEYFKGNINLPPQEVASLLAAISPRLYKIDQRYIDNVLLDSLSIFNSLTLDDLVFLI